MKQLLSILLLFFALTAKAQGEANNWFFGQKAGLNFNNGSVTVTSGNLNTEEGCASFSDKDGNLLFYSDGTHVWNKLGNIMPNGGDLKGNSSSTQSAIIVPNPKNNNQFFIFTVGVKVNDGEYGLHCYTVDMSLGSNGDVVPGSELNLSRNLSHAWTEKVTSVKGADCNTFWVISLVGNTFYSYKIDESGLNTSPEISPVNYLSEDKRGYLKVSPDGKKLASATFTRYYDYQNKEYVIGPGKLHLYSFNDATGKVSNDAQLLISNAEIDGAPYGVEFSSNSTKLYTSTFDGDNNKLFQFDLSSSTIAATKYLVNSQIGYRGALQLAPDGKIYTTIPQSYEEGTNHLNSINLPDELGVKCGYTPEAINLGPSRFAMQGLPPFIASLLLPIKITNNDTNEIITNKTVKLCVGSDYTFNTEPLAGSPTYTWKKNDTILSLPPNTSSLNLTNIQLNEDGIYEVSAEADDCGVPKTYIGKFEVEVYEPPSTVSDILYDQCDIDDNPTDYITIFNLEVKTQEFIQDNEDLYVEFYKSESDYDINYQITNTSNYSAEDSTPIIVKILHKESGCFTKAKMILNVFPTSLDTYNDVYSCENDLEQNNSSAIKSIGSGNGTFDFESIRESIHELYSYDPTLEIEFFNSTDDTQLQSNNITGINNFSNSEIYVRISTKETNKCLSIGTFNLMINPIPEPYGIEDPIPLCVSNPRDNPQLFTKNLVGGIPSPNETYQWYFNGIIINDATSIEYIANKEGTYKLEVTRSNQQNDNLCVGFSTFKIFESNIATITENDITVIDDSLNNSIAISTDNLGIGDYEFSLNDRFSNFQNAPYFDNIPAGIHTVYIRDKNACGTSKIEVSVLGFPNFFTPNNDGVNDTWSISGVNDYFYASSKVHIFDRFGKLITSINPNGNGWDGVMNGRSVPATDYWFTAELVDNTGKVRIRKGHFSLIR